MKLKICYLIFLLYTVNSATAQDIIVKKDGTILEVYNMEESPNSIFYSLEPSEDATMLKISKDDVFSVKKKDGIQPSHTNVNNAINTNKVTSRETVTAQISSEIINNKSGRSFSARTPDGHELNYVILSEKDHTLAVTKGDYNETEYVIPEYVQVDTDIYTVTEIADKAFYEERSIINIYFPRTLKKIGKESFVRCRLDCIILPEGLEEIGEKSFSCYMSRNRKTIREIYLPSSLKRIGEKCFIFCGANLSPYGYCQANFTNLPNFVTKNNCEDYGIDDGAVETFYNRKSR